MMIKAAGFEVEPWEQGYIKKQLRGISFKFSVNALSQQDLPPLKDCELLFVFVNSCVDKKVLSRLPRLRAIFTLSTGFDNIDLATCRKRGIHVFNVPSYGENTVAEHAMALLLCLSRKIIPSVLRTRGGDFTTDVSLRGFDLHGKTMGVVGTGRIGKHLITMAQGFGMTVLAHDHHPDTEFAQHHNFCYVSLKKLFSQSDVLSFHVPYMPATHHLLNKKNLGWLKKGIIIINTARGGVIDTDALVLGLQKGIIAGAGLDVLEEEKELHDEKELLYLTKNDKKALATLLEDHVLMDHQHVLVTPHNAFNTTEALTRILDTTIQNVEGCLKKKYINEVPIS